MRKILLFILLLVSTASVVEAIPRGAYCDKRGRVVYIVDQSGKEIYSIDRDGNVTITRVVESEQYDRETGITKVILRTVGMTVQTVIYYKEENGQIYLDDGLRVLTHD